MTHFINFRIWVQQNIHEAKSMIKDILNQMKKKMNSCIKSSISSVDRNIINSKTIKQDSFVIKTISVKRILSNQKLRKSSVTISCQSISQMIRIEERVQYSEDL
jgi:hypothetical protein